MRFTNSVPAILATGFMLISSACAGVLPQSNADADTAEPLSIVDQSSTTPTIAPGETATGETGTGETGETGPTTTVTGETGETSETGETDPTTAPAPVQDPQVNQTLARYVGWQDPGYHSTDDRELRTDDWIEVHPENGRQRVVCTPSPISIPPRQLDDFPAFGFLGDNVMPGLVVEGRSVASGDLRVLPLDRAPFTLRSSLASANPTVVVENPNSGTVAEAVATLKRDADPRLGGVDVTAADINYGMTETHSFEQSSLDLGVSLRYRSRLVSAGLETDYSQQESVERHTITVRMVQRQLTLSIVDDVFTQPGQYFAPTVSTADVQALENQGAIGADSPPMVVDRVVYGRVMYFTMSSTKVSSAQDLRVAIEAVKGRYEGEGQVNASHIKTINESEIQMVAYGGDQTLATNAIRSGDISLFFGPANPTAASPLTFGLRTLGGAPVLLSETADVQQLSCQRTPEPYEFSFNITEVQGRLRVYVNGHDLADVRDNNPVIGRKVDGTATLGGDRLNSRLNLGSNDVELRYTNLGCDNRFVVSVNNGSTSTNFFHPDKNRCIGEGDLTMTFTIDTTTGEVTSP